MHKNPGIFLSVLPLLFMALLLGVGYGIYKISAEILLVLAAIFTGIIGKYLNYTWKEMEEGIVEVVRQALPAMFIVITVGMLISSWIASGTIPMLIYYGLDMINPSYFLLTACVVCSFISIFTGTSWGTVGTVGVAFMGIAQGLGISLPAAAGAIISGAYFGDKLSPFSDTTNLAPVAAKSNLFDHIRHMLWTTVPAWLLGLTVYFIVGHHAGNSIQSIIKIDTLQQGILTHFRFHLFLMLPPVVVILFAVKKWPTIPGMISAITLAVIGGWWIQELPLPSLLDILVKGYRIPSESQQLDMLLHRGGMMSMMGVTLIAFCAFAFAGIMQKTGMLEQILNSLLKWIKSTGSLIMSTALSSATIALITGSSFLTILIPGELFSSVYRSRGLAAKNLSRTTEDSGTVIVPLIPWSMAGIFMASTLGVSTLSYLPWCIMNYSGIIIAVIYGFTGIGIATKIRDDETVPGS
ncbi:MAG: Na+/H+ antiporter NhaC [Calditrichia bacterium]